MFLISARREEDMRLLRLMPINNETPITQERAGSPKLLGFLLGQDFSSLAC
jgi:hypothetical protein